MSEKWYIVGTHPNYRVSGDGERVQNMKTGRDLKQCDNDKGYRTVNLYNNGHKTTIGVHRLVAELCVEGSSSELTVNHKDANKHNNHPDNLEWVTYSENELHAHRMGIKHGPNRRPIKVVESGEIFPSIKECARAIGVSDSNIGRSLRENNRSYHGLTFKYVDIEPDEITKSDGAVSRSHMIRKPYRKRVKVVETGEIYPSIRECAKQIGASNTGIVDCLKGKHKTHHGYHYEYVYE